MKRTARELLGAPAVAALRHPELEQARGLPAAAYTSPAFFELEQQQLFPSVWTGVAFDTDLPGIGDAVPVVLCGQPIILVRDGQDVIRAFHNVCRHRATIVLVEPCRALSSFKCPYHGWTYSLDGALKATPFWDGTPDAARRPVDRQNNGLVPIACGTWNHVVFVNLDGKAEPLGEYLAPMATELDHLDIDGLALGHRVTWEFKANWKLVMDNWEVYHHVWVHDGVFDKMSDEVDIQTGEPYTDALADGNVMMLRTNRPRPAEIGKAIAHPLPPIALRYAKTECVGTANAVLPNTTVTVSPTTFSPAVYTPIAPDRTRASMAWYFAPEAASGDAYSSGREAILDRWLGPSRRLDKRDGIRPQDHRCMELQQAARGSPVADDVKFSPTWEADVRYFQRWLIDRLD